KEWSTGLVAGAGADRGKKFVVNFLEGGGVNLIIGADGEQCVAICERTHDCLSSDIAAGTRPVLNDELLTEPLGEPLTYYARDDVNRLARGKSDDDAHRPRRIGLRPCDPRDGRQRGSPRCQMQEFAAGKFHHCQSPRPFHSITSSARASSVGGTSRPSAFAVFILITSSYLVGACTGRSAGFSPLRMRST